MAGILDLFDGKLNENLADLYDMKLAVFHAVISDRMDLAERLFESFIAAQLNVYELLRATRINCRSQGLSITREIKRMRSDRRENANFDVLRAALSTVKNDPVASSTYEMLASWMSLVEAEISSKKPKAVPGCRARNGRLGTGLGS